MPERIVVRIPHSLGKAEATRRVKTGVSRASIVLPKIMRVEQSTTESGEALSGNRALCQIATANVTVEDKSVLVEANVPTFLAPFAEKARSFTKSYGSKLLTGPPPRN
jgi:hypothetical protein